MHYSMLKGEFITCHPVEYLRLQFLIISDHGFSIKVDLAPWINLEQSIFISSRENWVMINKQF